MIGKSVWNYIKIMQLDKYMVGHSGFIAGGCFKNIFLNEKIKDIDMFFESEIDLGKAELYYDANADYVEYYSTNKVKAYQNRESGVVIELVKSVYGTPEEVLNDFDFTITKFAYYKHLETNENQEETLVYKVLCHEDFFEHLLLRRLVINGALLYPVSSFERMIRYTKYGFYPCKDTKKRLLEAIYELDVLPEISGGLYDGLD